MSQSGRLTTNIPVPGAGIQTVTGNVGGPVPGDGAANINLIGAGIITVTGNPGTNTLTIGSLGAPAQYTTDAGIALPTLAGNLNVIGGLNILTDAALANTVRIRLTDNVAITGTFQAGGDISTTAGDIVADTGDVVATLGNLIASAGIVYGVGGGRFDNTVLITAGGLDSTGPTILRSLARGVAQIDAANTMFTSEGTNGQLLIGSTVGPALWRNLTVGGGLIQGIAANSIALSCAGTVAQTFPADAGIAIPAGGALQILGDGINTNTTGVGNILRVALDTNLLVDSVTTSGAVVPYSIITGAGSGIHSGGTLLVDGVSTLNADLNVTGVTTLTGDVNIVGGGTLLISALPSGVLSIAAGTVFSSNGNPSPTPGQVLISGNAGNPPQWAFLTSPDGTIVFTPGVNSLGLSAPAVTPAPVFRAVLTPALSVHFDVANPQFYFGTQQVLVVDFDTNGAFYPGDGAAARARFTAPFNGIYNICINAEISNGANFDLRTLIFNIVNIDSGTPYISQQDVLSPVNAINTSVQPLYGSAQFTQLLIMAAGQRIEFSLEPRYSTTVGTNWTLGFGGNCCVTGFMVRRL